jgi:hypothetical protein
LTFESVNSKKKTIETLAVFGWVFLIIGMLLLMGAQFAGFVLLAAGMALIIKTQYDFKKLSKAFKDVFTRGELEKILGEIRYSPSSGMDRETVYGSLILKKEDRYSSEDYLEAAIDGRRFKSADVHLQDVRSNGKSTTVVTVFRGRFFEIESPKAFPVPVYVLPNRTAFLGTYQGMERIDLESIAFNDRFDVFSTDRHEAFLLLKPAFMEQLALFSRVARRTMFGFSGNTIHVALDTRKDTFDLKMFRPLDQSHLDEIKDEIRLVRELFSLLS